MDENIDKACKQEIAAIGAHLQRSRIRLDSAREKVKHEEEGHLKLLGSLETVTSMMEKNASA